MNRYDHQRKAIAGAARRFESECSGHVMTVKHDDGLYRHLRFVAAEGYSHWFDLITWPGNLTFNGDMGCFTFARVEDMFTFFRGKDINPQYWAEKVRGETEVKAYSEDVLRAELDETLADHEREYLDLLARYFELKATFDALPQKERWPFATRGMREPVEPKTADEVRELISDYDDDGLLSYESGARDLLAELEKADVVSDTGEWSLREYTVFYLYACHAIQWGIGQYDAAKVPDPDPVATQPLPAPAPAEDRDDWENDFSNCPRCGKPRANSWTDHCEPCDGPQEVVSGGAEAGV